MLRLLPLVYRFIDLILYGNFWIAACALSLSLQTQWLFTKELSWRHPLHAFIFLATLFLYALHRIIGLEKVARFHESGRYKIATLFRLHILLYAIAAGIGAFVLFWKLSASVQWALILPILVSLGYILPFVKKKYRLRDLNYIKIFLLALVWAWVTVVLPALEFSDFPLQTVGLLALERGFFIFAAAIPFDIRDVQVDAYTNVQTLPTLLGVAGAKRLSYILLGIMLLVSGVLFFQHFYTASNMLALVISALLTSTVVFFSDTVKHDYYFAGLLDSMMLVQFLLLYASSFFLTY